MRIEEYMEKLIRSLKRQFDGRLVYIGLQGSYMRGEANENSDIDVMAVIDNMDVSDMEAYRIIVKSMDEPEKTCGFICSKKDLANWNPLEINHLIHTTKDYYGVLRTLVPTYTEHDIVSFVKMSVNNLYHELCHRFIHREEESSAQMLSGTYKGVFFILQNLYFLKHGKFYQTKEELLQAINGKDHDILQRALDLNNGMHFEFRDCYEMLFKWCQETMQSL